MSERLLDKFSSFLFFFLNLFLPKSAPRGDFGTNNIGIDAESARESENTTRNLKEATKSHRFRLKPLRKKLEKLV